METSNTKTVDTQNSSSYTAPVVKSGKIKSSQCG